MTAIVTGALVGSAALMLLVLAVRGPVRHWVGPRVGFALWALPVARLLLPPLPNLFAALPTAGRGTGGVAFLFAGPRGVAAAGPGGAGSVATALLVLWLAGAIGVFVVCAARHVVFCRRLRATSTDFGRIGPIRIVAADVAGPLALGVVRRVVAVPRTFVRDYDAAERDLALAHERAHHARGDLLANWVSLIVLAVHWWNPVAWVAIRAFRDDQEFAADAHVLAGRDAAARPVYAHVLARAAGIGALPVCNLNARSNLKGRMMMLGQTPRLRRHLAAGGVALALLGGTALAATATPPAAPGGTQAVTIGVKPDGAGGYALIVDGAAVAAGAPLPRGTTLPADFDAAGGCDLKPTAQPRALAIKGAGTTRTYTVMCASAAPAPMRTTLAEGLASLKTMRAAVATQPASKVFPETERTHALGAIDRSIREVEATLAGAG